jgi:hypothetical protein
MVKMREKYDMFGAEDIEKELEGRESLQTGRKCSLFVPAIHIYELDTIELTHRLLDLSSLQPTRRSLSTT